MTAPAIPLSFNHFHKHCRHCCLVIMPIAGPAGYSASSRILTKSLLERPQYTQYIGMDPCLDMRYPHRIRPGLNDLILSKIDCGVNDG